MFFETISTSSLIKLLISFSIINSYIYFIEIFKFTFKQVFIIYLYLFLFTFILSFLLNFNDESVWGLINTTAATIVSFYYSKKNKND
jgi:hypothetical protein